MMLFSRASAAPPGAAVIAGRRQAADVAPAAVVVGDDLVVGRALWEAGRSLSGLEWLIVQPQFLTNL
jgi:hypothetical protein